MIDITTPFGPTGEIVYNRTYSRKKADGQNETWPETVRRVATGNLALVHGADMDQWSDQAIDEWTELVKHMLDFRIIPAGRHLWASGVKGRQYLFNCHVAGWGETLARHFEFTFLRLMEGGGVGANYSTKYIERFGGPRRQLHVHIVCDPGHPDYMDMASAGLLSEEYDSDWEGSFEVEDSREGWSDALVDLIDTFMSDEPVKHTNRVYDVSRVRGKGSRLKTFGGTASGPLPFARMMMKVGEVLNRRGPKTPAGAQSLTIETVEGGITRRVYFPAAMMGETGEDGTFSFTAAAVSAGSPLTPVDAMEIDHAIAECVVSGGNRRSARMAIVRWDDPYIFEFLACKEDSGLHWTTNISVEIDDEFINALSNRQYDDDMEAHARAVHTAVVEGMLTNGEPGYWNSSLSNVGEPNEVQATNPCGEIALEPWENCNLGHVNLDAFAGTGVESWGAYELANAHRLMTRFLMRATYGDVNDSEQADTLARNRRIGVGHLGVQGYLAKNGVRYSEAPSSLPFVGLLHYLSEVVDREAIAYAHELRIPVPVKKRTMAPTGSIAKLPGVTEGGHPIYARHFDRRVRFSMTDPDQRATVNQAFEMGLGVEVDMYDPSGNTMIVVYPTMEKLVADLIELGLSADLVESVDEIALGDMLAFQAMYQTHWADNAVSFTVNVPAEPHQAEAMAAGEFTVPAPSRERVNEVAEVLAEYLPVLKGTTLMLDGSRPQAPYTRITKEQYDASLVKSVEDGTDEECTTGACPVR